jgi:hypothetical protein
LKNKTRSGIDPTTLRKVVNDLFDTSKAAQTKSEQDWTRNVIDPFAALFEITGFGLDTHSWTQNEKRRQAQKTLQNNIGVMHQQLIAALPGWEDAKTGKIIDVVNDKAKIIAEIKNKYNTVSGASLTKPYDALFSQVNDKGQKYHGYTAYFVQIIPEKPTRYNKPFTPSDNKTSSKRASNERVRIIDGASFYALAHGDADALELIFSDLIDSAIEVANERGLKPNLDASVVRGLFKTAFYPVLPSS